jgi:hypothetical protein
MNLNNNNGVFGCMLMVPKKNATQFLIHLSKVRRSNSIPHCGMFKKNLAAHLLARISGILFSSGIFSYYPAL